jgi:hypothetical protein
MTTDIFFSKVLQVGHHIDDRKFNAANDMFSAVCRKQKRNYANTVQNPQIIPMLIWKKGEKPLCELFRITNFWTKSFSK